MTSSTGVTGSPASAIARAESPVDTRSTPASTSAAASGSNPVLSDTDSSARRIGRLPASPSAAVPPTAVANPRAAAPAAPGKSAVIRV